MKNLTKIEKLISRTVVRGSLHDYSSLSLVTETSATAKISSIVNKTSNLIDSVAIEKLIAQSSGFDLACIDEIISKEFNSFSLPVGKERKERPFVRARLITGAVNSSNELIAIEDKHIYVLIPLYAFALMDSVPNVVSTGKDHFIEIKSEIVTALIMGVSNTRNQNNDSTKLKYVLSSDYSIYFIDKELFLVDKCLSKTPITSPIFVETI